MQHHAALSAACGRTRHTFPNLFEQLGPETAEFRDLPGLQRPFQVRDAVHLQLVVEQLDALGAEAGDPQQIEQAGRDGRDELLTLGQGARVEQRSDLFRNTAADPRQVGEVERLVCDEL